MILDRRITTIALAWHIQTAKAARFMEISNQVFMQYRRLEDGSFEPLEKKNVDFGGGIGTNFCGCNQ